MKLDFIPERLTIIRRLRDLTISEIERRMKELGHYTNRLSIDRWELVEADHKFDKVELLAAATEVPVGFYYYKNVQITLIDLIVSITIVDTGEHVSFDFIQKG
jgi:transcriptional regulator with XRE-family HTH domain